jgi:hypothetical protein
MNKKAMILIVGFVVVLLLSSNISFAEEEIVYDQIISNVVVSDETDYIISTNTIVSGIIEGNVIVNSGVYLKLDGIINGDLTLEPGSMELLFKKLSTMEHQPMRITE